MKKRFRMTTAIVIVLGLALTLVWIKREVVFQEGNPLPIAVGIVKLSITNDEVVKVSSAPDKYLMRARNGTQIFRSYMENNGWTFIDQLGAGLVFERDGIKQMFISRMMTRYYQVVKGPLEQQ